MRYDDEVADRLREEHHRDVVERLQAEMARDDLDALVVFRADYINWINGHESFFLQGGGIGMAMVVVPRAGKPIGICSDHEYDAMNESGLVDDWRAVRTWTGIEDRYADQIDVRYASDQQLKTPEGLLPFVTALRNTLEQEGLGSARLGVEINSLSVSWHKLLVSQLFDHELVNSGHILRRAWMIKTDYEIYNVRYAAHQQWLVCHDIMMNLKPGDSYAELRQRIDIGVAQAPAIDGNKFLMIYMGDTPSATSRHFDRCLAEGDMISVDLGFMVRGYLSDSGRAYVMGEPSELQQKIAGVYGQAHQTVKRSMVPGARLGDLYDMAADMVRDHGLSEFRRGHIGHGLGCCSFIEEFPFTMAGADTVLEPNMLMTLEIPFYGRGFGAYFEEDIVLINEGGNESLTSAPFGLNVIPVS